MTLSTHVLYVTLSITILCHYAEFAFLFDSMLNVIILSAVMPRVVALSTRHYDIQHNNTYYNDIQHSRK
jgi:hypothetical protein